jgi:hypothetical protein
MQEPEKKKQNIDQHGLILDHPTAKDLPHMLDILTWKRYYKPGGYFKVARLREHARKSLGSIYFRRMALFYLERCEKLCADDAKLMKRAKEVFDSWDELMSEC